MRTLLGTALILLSCILLPSHIHAQVIPTDSIPSDSLTPGKGELKGPRSDTVTVKEEGKGELKGDVVTDSGPIKVMGDSSVTDTAQKGPRRGKNKVFDPEKAYKRSLLLPGWGQAYNRSPWKIPIIYAGFAGLGYAFIKTNQSYNLYRDAQFCKQDTSCTFFEGVGDLTFISEQSLINERDYYRRWRDLTVIVGVIWYALNVVDAYVEGHLKMFNTDDDIAIFPRIMLDPMSQRYEVGAGLTIRLGK